MGETKSHGRKVRPLNRDQIEAFDAAAQASSDTLTKLTARTLLYTGLRSGEFCHLRRGWLKLLPSVEVKLVQVPDEEECIGGVPNETEEDSNGDGQQRRGVPCYGCKTHREGQWNAKSSHSVRAIPLPHDSVWDSLMEWFYTHEQIPLLPNAARERIQRVATEAGLDRDVTPRDLRHTYGTLLASSDLNRPEVEHIMGYRTSDPILNFHEFANEEMGEFFEELCGSETDDVTDSDNDE
jgi:integrase